MQPKFTFGLICLLAAIAHADAIDDYIKTELEKQHIPGLSLVVAKEGVVIKSAAYGLANVEWNLPATPQTVFQIQSVTKTFTATAIMMLVEEGRLSLDDPVSKHLDAAPANWADITIRHLLTHTSGIKDFINEPTASLRLDVSEEEVLKATAPRELNFKPGEKYAYSNTGYHLLAMIIRKLTGKSYGQFLQERIFVPLGMTSTRIVTLREVVPNRAAGYRWRDGKLVNGQYIAESILSYGGGGIMSTALDLAKWDAALYGEKLVKKTTLEEMWGPAKLNNGKTSGYGLGWATTSTPHRLLSHAGSHMTGFTSYMGRHLDYKLTVIVLCNSQNADPGKIARIVAGMMESGLASK